MTIGSFTVPETFIPWIIIGAGVVAFLIVLKIMRMTIKIALSVFLFAVAAAVIFFVFNWVLP
ncbi:MAG: hypothetical protein PHG63_03190 [Candidatus Dojkabacteria bacterium]|nr:hypothetical protein [Candidatus Dojkabacteria bacterium]